MNESQPSTQLMDGILMGESPRWHDGKLWFADWVGETLYTLTEGGQSEVVAQIASLPFSIDWLPDGRLLVVNAAEKTLQVQQPDGSFATFADLSGLSEYGFNEIVVAANGNIYVNNINFDFPGGAFQPGFIALVTPDGKAVRQAGDLAFPNGMAITAGRQDADLRRILQRQPHRVRHRARWAPVQPAALGQDRRPGRRWHLY